MYLAEIEAWSSANPNHLPVMVMVEIKAQSVPDAAAAEGIELLDALDAELTSVFDSDQLITPDDVRGDAATLESAVLQPGWPTLEDSRGKVMILLNNQGDVRDLSSTGARTSRVGRCSRAPAPVMPMLHSCVWTTRIHRRLPTSRRPAAFASGAQFLSTDYYLPSTSTARTWSPSRAAPSPAATR